jgi:DNA repair exonuclease SbcCD nuclease subunit
MFTFLHASDLHLDAPIQGVSGEGMPDSIADALRDASLTAWDALVEEAIERRVSFVLLAGGIHEGSARGTRGQLRFRAGLSRLDAAGIRTFIAQGRTDQPEDPWVVADPLPESVHRFEAAPGGTGKAASVSFEANGDPVTIHAIGDSRHAPADDLVARFPTRLGAGFHIGLLPAGIDGAPETDEGAATVALGDLTKRKIHYWALGGSRAHHVHHGGDPLVVAAGGLQARSPEAVERGPKGATFVTVAGGRAAGPELLALDRVRFESVAVDVTELTTVAELLDRLQEAADNGAHDDRSLIMRATITGSGPLHERFRDPANRGEVLDALRPTRVVQPFVWWDRVDWRLQPALDLEETRKGNDFLADLLATAQGGSGATSWRAGVPRLPADIARQLALVPSAGDADVISQALGLALDELTEGHA